MNKIQRSGGIAAPNLLSICVDAGTDGELSGRLYSCYTQEPDRFGNVIQLLRCMENFYNQVQFPEAAVMLRNFEKIPQKRRSAVPEQKNAAFCRKNGAVCQFDLTDGWFRMRLVL